MLYNNEMMLMNRIQKVPLQTEDIHKLDSISKDLLSTPYEQGLELVQELLAVMNTLDFSGHETLQAQKLALIGAFYGSSSKPKEAQMYFSEVLALVEKHSISSMLIGAQANLAICKAQCGNYLEAIAIWKELIQSNIDTNMRMHILNNISVSYADMGDYDRTLEYAYKTMDLAINNKCDGPWLSALMNLSTAYENMGDYHKALDFINQALVLAKKLGNIRRECQCLNNLSLIQNKLNEHEIALQNAEECLLLRQQYLSTSVWAALIKH
jgi:tetratricopeptide (TPR) repeat protein